MNKKNLKKIDEALEVLGYDNTILLQDIGAIRCIKLIVRELHDERLRNKFNKIIDAVDDKINGYK